METRRNYRAVLPGTRRGTRILAYAQAAATSVILRRSNDRQVPGTKLPGAAPRFSNYPGGRDSASYVFFREILSIAPIEPAEARLAVIFLVI